MTCKFYDRRNVNKRHCYFTFLGHCYVSLPRFPLVCLCKANNSGYSRISHKKVVAQNKEGCGVKMFLKFDLFSLEGHTIHVRVTKHRGLPFSFLTIKGT